MNFDSFTRLKNFALAILCFISVSAFAQSSIINLELDGSETGKQLNVVLKDIESKHDVRFYFLDEWIGNITFTESFRGKTLGESLRQLFLGTDLNFVEVNAYTIVIVKDPSQVIRHNDAISVAKRERKKVEKVTFGTPSSGVAANKTYALSGIILDQKNNNPLTGVTIYIRDLNTGGRTDAEGHYNITIPSGPHVISFTYLNYEEKVVDLDMYANGSLDQKLEEIPTLLDEIVVQDRSVRDITQSSIGVAQISMKELKRAPAMLGEVDLIKQIQTLPGVTTTGEASSGFNVRGGSVDQNLILYDGLPLFNASHVFGFFSAFNADAIRDVTFYRGGIPAEFGGRMSSVLNIRSKEGDYEKWTGGGGIGIISSNASVGGPIVKNKTSLNASVRTTYSDWLIHSVKSNYVDLSKASVRFYDGSAKLTHKFSGKTKLTASGYLSHDEFRLRGDSTFKWDSKLASLTLDHEISPGFTGALMLGYGSYQYNVVNTDPFSGFDLHYRMQYPTAKAGFVITREKHKIEFGGQGIYYNFNPGTLAPNSETSDLKYTQIQNQQSVEAGLYVGDEFNITKELNVNVGVRVSMFEQLGPADVNIYKAGAPRETSNLVDTLHFNKGDNVKRYINPEPRIGLRYTLSENSSIKLGYNRIFQYLHLVTNTTAVTPVDIWQPSGYYFKPQLGDQISGGYFRTFPKKNFESYIEVYYKTMKNVLDFKDGAVLLLNPRLETDLLQGKGRAYGAEISFTRTAGQLTGTLSYSYSRSFRTIVGLYEQETINGGREYRSNYDQPNVVNLAWRYTLSRRLFFTGQFQYHTGRPITLPLTAYSIENYTVSGFSDRNQFRIPDYHRLDLGFVLEGNHKRKKFLDGTWTFSVYNVYARKNPYSVFFKEALPGILRPYRLAIIGTALPSLSYSFKLQ
jgi:hypothetical protein